MKINLLDLPALYVNLDKDTGKNIRAKNVLEGLGFQNIIRIPGERHENTRIGCSIGHLKALITVKPPFIVFEDDIAIKDFRQTVDIPDDADGLYLGLGVYSWDGTTWGTNIDYVKQEKYDDIYRVKNMLSAHAILYITPEYVEQSIKDIHASVVSQEPHDLRMAVTQQNKVVYCVGSPMFYQDDPNGNVYAKSITDITLSK